MHTLWIEHFQLKFSKWSNGLARCGMRFLNSPILKELIWPLTIESFKKYNHPHVHFLNPVKNANIFICAYSAFSNQPKPFLVSWGHGNDSEMAYKLFKNVLSKLRTSTKLSLASIISWRPPLLHPLLNVLFHTKCAANTKLTITRSILKLEPRFFAW